MAAVQAQNINVTSANSSNGYVFSLNFFGPGAPTATSENSDHKNYSSIQSVAFITNPSSFALDLVVADNKSGNIAFYPGDFTPGANTAASVFWTAAQGGPTSPDGLSVDGAGDLFVVSTGTTQQLWVFPAAGTGTPACTPLPLYAALCSPVRVDVGFARGLQLVETTLVPGGMPNAGDLLVLTNNPAKVLDYHFTGGNFAGSTPSTLITLPAGTTTGGLAFWPADNSLLISNQTTDTVLRYSCCNAPAPMTPFASNLGGNGHLLYKIKTGYQGGFAPYAFLAESGSVSFILQFGAGTTDSAPGTLLHTLDIHSGINHPEGLAVANAASAPPNGCTGNGCDPTGLLFHVVPPNQQNHTNSSPALVENVCVVPVDPRVTYNGNTWSCNGNPLKVNDVCPGFDTTGTHMFIPGYMCGKSGDNTILPGPAGFTLIKSLTSGAGFNATLVDNVTNNIAMEPVCLPAVGNDPATIATLLWAPVAGEGSFVADGVTNETLEVTDGCGTVHGGTSGNSLWGEGLVLNTAFFPGSATAALAALADAKYQDLETTVQTLTPANIASTVGPQLSANNTTGCVPLSKTYFDFAQFEAGNPPQQTQDLKIAADLLTNADTSGSPTSSLTCDSIVNTNIPNPNNFTETPNSTPPVFNPSGQVRSRLANLYFTINSRILGNSPNTGNPEPAAWPPMGSELVTPPPSGFTECSGEPAGLYPPPGGCPTISVPATVLAGGSVTVSWSLFGSTPCTLNSGGGDSTFTGGAVVGTSGNPTNTNAPGQMVTATSIGGTYTYTLACSGPEISSVQTQLTVRAPVVMSVSPPGVGGGGSAQVTWTPQAGSTGCTLTSNASPPPSGTGGMFTSGTTTVSGPTTGTAYQATYTSTEGDAQTNNGIVTFTASCTAGAAPGTAQLMVNE